MRPARAYLLVYHVEPNKPGNVWFDQGNDPEMRQPPMTWGICRPNVRRWLAPDDLLFFLADRRQAPFEERAIHGAVVASPVDQQIVAPLDHLEARNEAFDSRTGTLRT